MTETVTINARSRNLGYGWTNSVVQDGNHLRIASETITPFAQGGPATVCREISDAYRLNSGNDWAGALFVAGRRVVRYVDPVYVRNASDAMQEIAEGNTVTVEVCAKEAE